MLRFGSLGYMLTGTCTADSTYTVLLPGVLIQVIDIVSYSALDLCNTVSVYVLCTQARGAGLLGGLLGE